MAADPRHIVGSMVEVKACHVMHLAECSCHYVSNSKTKRVQRHHDPCGGYQEFNNKQDDDLHDGSICPGGMMICPCRLNIRSVRAVLTRTVATVTTAGGALLWSTDRDLMMTEVTTPPAATEPMLEAPTNVDASLEEPTVAVLREPPPLTTKNNNNIIANNDTPLPEVAAMVHDQEWFVDDPAGKFPVNGNYHFRNWAIKTRMGYMLGQGGDHQNSYSHQEYFWMLFPPEQLQLMLQLTNNELAMARKNHTTTGEIVKFFGVMLLVTQFEFGSWASLWSNTSTNKYIPAPLFGLTGCNGSGSMTCGCASGLVINHTIVHLR